MPATTLPHASPYAPPPPTTENLEWAELPVIDISKASTAEGRAELALSVRDAMRTIGFLYVVNHGMTLTQTQRVFDIGDVPFTQVTGDEMKQYDARTEESGTRIGYKPRQLWTTDNCVRDEYEQYAFLTPEVHRSIFGEQQHPMALQPFLPELRAFAEHNHFNVLYPLLRVLALGMELPENTFVDLHDFDAAGDTSIRFIKYHPRPEEEELKAKNVWLKGHTDTGTITILWSQPVAALQMMAPDGKWRWVRHVENALVVNIGDSLDMLSGGFYKATIHRVVQPPPDQRGYSRLCVCYFGMTNDDVKLLPFIESPVLKRVGVVRKIDDANAPTMGEWRKSRATTYGYKATTRRDEVVEEQIVQGVVVKQYN